MPSVPAVNTASQATPDTGSLDAAAHAFHSILALEDDASGTEAANGHAPEQRAPEKKKKPEAAQQAPAASTEPDEKEASAEGSEQADTKNTEQEADDESERSAQPDTFLVTLPGGEKVEVTRDELLSGYSRTQDYTKKTMELASKRKEFETTELPAVRQEREAYRSALTQLQDAMELLHPKEPDWNRLRVALPLEQYVAQREEWDGMQKRIADVKAERQRVESEQAREAQTGFQSYLETQQQKLIEADPDFGDPTKAPALRKDLGAFAQTLGFSNEELEQVTDHRLVLLLRKAMKQDQAEKATPKVEQKIKDAIQTAQPGASRSTGAKPNKLNTAMGRLRQSGRTEDAALAIEQLL